MADEKKVEEAAVAEDQKVEQAQPEQIQAEPNVVGVHVEANRAATEESAGIVGPVHSRRNAPA